MLNEIESIHRAENVALDRVLRRVLKKSGLAMPRGSSAGAPGPLQILDLACGSCREAGTLVEVFRDFEGANRDVRLVGADIRDRELEEAAARARLVGRTRDQFEFLTENCAKLDRHRELGRDFDVTFLRRGERRRRPVVHRSIYVGAAAGEEPQHLQVAVFGRD